MGLIILEILAPGAYFLWMGVAAMVVGAVLFLVPATPFLIQVLIFAIFSALALVLYKSWQRRHPTTSDEPTLNRRGKQYIGREFVLQKPIKNGTGKITVDDSSWHLQGEDAQVGMKVRVVAVEGTILKVKAME